MANALDCNSTNPGSNPGWAKKLKNEKNMKKHKKDEKDKEVEKIDELCLGKCPDCGSCLYYGEVTNCTLSVCCIQCKYRHGPYRSQKAGHRYEMEKKRLLKL